MTRSPRNHRITIIYQILHLMYCRIYVNLYDAVRSVIPCDKLHKHQFSFNNDGQQRASFGWEREFQYGGNFSVSWDRNFPEINFGFTSQFFRTHGTMPPINFRVELKACFCWIKWLTSNIRHNRNNFHLMWESTKILLLLVHGHRRRGQFSHGRCAVWRFGGIWLACRYYA